MPHNLISICVQIKMKSRRNYQIWHKIPDMNRVSENLPRVLKKKKKNIPVHLKPVNIFSSGY